MKLVIEIDKENIGECGNTYYLGACEFGEKWWNTPYKAEKESD